MTTTPKILLKKSSVAGRVPGASDLDYGELAINFEDGKIYYKDASNNIAAFIDSARVEAIANAVEVVAQAQLDSSEVTDLIDSDYIQLRIPETYLEGLIDSAYVAARQVYYTTFNSDFDTRLATKSTDDVAEGTNLYYTKARADSDIASSLSDSGNSVSITINNTITDTVDSAYVLARVAEAPFLDSVDTIQLIDSAYIQARESTPFIPTFGTDFVDSATVSTIITTNVDKAFIDSLDVDASTLNNQAASYYLDYANLNNTPTVLDATNVNSLIDTRVDKPFVDALNVDADTLDGQNGTHYLDYTNFTNTPVIDSAYIQLRDTPQDFAYASLTGAPTIPQMDVDFVDSARVIRMISNEALDSDLTIALVDSAYIQLRDRFQDSSLVTTTVDNAYVQARQIQYNTSDFTDSAFVTGLPVSTFTNDAGYLTAGTVGGLDSGLVVQLIDSAYVQARTTAGTDSASVINLITNNTTTTTKVDSFGALALINNVAEADFAYNDINHDVYFATSLNPSLTVSHSLVFSGDERIVSSGARVSPFQTITVAKTSKTGNLRIYGAVHSVASLNATFPNSTAGYFASYQPNVSIRVPGEGSNRTINALIVAQTTATFVDNNDGTWTAPFEIKGVLAISGTDISNPTNIANTFYAWTSTLSDTNYSFNHSNSVYGLFPINASSVDYPIWTRIDQDSGFVTSIIDSAYIQARTTAGTDSAAIVQLIDSAYVNQRVTFTAPSSSRTALGLTAVTTGTNNATWTFDTDASAENFEGLIHGVQLPGSTTGGVLGFKDAAGKYYSIDDNFNSVGSTRTASASRTNNVVTVSWVGTGYSWVNSTDYTGGFSAAISANGGTLPLVSTYSGRISVNASGGFNNPYVVGDATSGTGYGTSSPVYGALVTVVASASYVSITNAIDSAYVQARVNALDSSEAINLIDSAYVRARQNFAYSSLTGTPTDLSDFDNDVGYITDASFDDFESREFIGNQGGLTDKVYSFIVPTGVTTISAVAIAGGGGGGGVQSGSGGDGGGGGLSYDTSLAVTPGETLTITVGHSGNGGQAPSDPPGATGTGDTAENVTIKRSSTILLQANGGTGGAGASNGSGGSGGTTLSYDGGGNGGVRGAGQYTGNGSTSGAASLLGTSGAALTKLYGEGGTGISNNGKKGAVRIIWGAGRSYPDTNIVQTFNNVYGSSGTDSATVISLINSTVDSDYIELRRPPEAVFVVTHSGSSAYTFNGDGFSSARNNPTLYLTRGKTYKFAMAVSGHPFQIRVSNGGSAYSTGVTNNGAVTGNILFTPDMNAPTSLVYQCTNHGGMVGNIVILDDTDAVGVDSAYVTSQINALIDGAPGTLDTLNEIASALNDDDSAYSTLITLINAKSDLDSASAINLIDSAYVQARQTSGGGGTVDSADIIAIVDSAYVQARQTSGGGAGGLDSALVSQLIDSAYVTARYTGSGITLATARGGISVTTGAASGGGALAYNNSTGVLTFNPSTNTGGSGGGGGGGISGTPSYFHFTADSGQSTFSGADDDSDTLEYIAGSMAVYLNGLLLVDSVDYTATNGTSVILTDASSTGDIVTVQKFVPAVDSADIIAIIDSDYIQARTTAGTDSAAIIQMIDSDYIGSKVDFTRGEFLTNRTDFTADSGQTVFSKTSIDTANLDVYLNGILQIPTVDYTTSNTAVTFNSGIDSGYSVSVVERRGRVATSRGLVENKFHFTTASPTTTITGTDDTGKTLDYSSGLADVFLNGILLRDSNDYTSNLGTSIVLVSPTDSNDIVTIVNRKGIVTSPTVDNFEFTADSGQTVFTGNDINGKTLAYSPDAIQVHVNGIALRSGDYVAKNGTIITLASAADGNDEILVSAFSNPGLNMEMYKFVADSAQTIFQGNDVTGASLAYEAGNIQVFLNGLLLNDSDDYVASNGISVRLLTGANLNDEFKVATFKSNRNYVSPTANAWDCAKRNTSCYSGRR